MLHGTASSPRALLLPGSPPLNGTHHDEVFGSVLDGPEDAQDDSHDVQEIGQDGRPLVAQEIKDLPLQRRYLGKNKGGDSAGNQSPAAAPRTLKAKSIV